MTLQEAADTLVGNWAKFEAFAWSERPDDAHLWALIPFNYRDATPTEARTARRRRGAIAKRDSSRVFVMRATHWAFGWMDHIAVKVKEENGSITSDFKWVWKKWIKNTV